MKKYIFISLAILLAISLVYDPVIAQYNTLIHGVQGGAEFVAESGGTITIKSGGTLTVDSGGNFTNNGTTSILEPIYTIAADSTMTTALLKSGGTVFVTGSSEVTLPSVAAGIVYSFITVGTDSIILIPAALDSIDSDGATGALNYVAAGVAGETVTIVGHNGDKWQVKSEIGTWATY